MALPFPQRTARAYQRTRVETARPTQLLLMLYDGAVRFLTVARDKFETGDIEGRHTNLVKAERIVAELLSNLNAEGSPELVSNLARLYEYMYSRIVEANLMDSTEPIDEVITMLRELRPAWEELDRKQSLVAQAA